jgi:hypothetical protein
MKRLITFVKRNIMSKVKKLVSILAVSAVLVSCGPTRFVEPLRKGQNAISATAGGPIINVPGVATLPLPMSSITYGRGVTNDITVYGSYFLTAAVFGTLQFDVGTSIRLIEHSENNWGVSAAPAINFAFDRFENNAKLWPQLDANFYWKYNARSMRQDDLLTKTVAKANNLYAGFGSWFELSSTRAHEEPQQNRIIPIFHLGHDWNWKSWGLKTELKVIAPNLSNQNIVVDYRSIFGDYGATGFYFGLTKRF